MKNYMKIEKYFKNMKYNRTTKARVKKGGNVTNGDTGIISEKD